MIAGDEWVLVENPKTASSSMKSVLLELGAEAVHGKHTPLFDQRLQAPNAKIRAVVVRNPYDRMVSAWKHHTRVSHRKVGDMAADFDEWLLGAPWQAEVCLDIKRTPQVVWAHRCGMVLRFERIEEEWERFLSAVGLPFKPLIHINKAPERPEYRDAYTPRTRQIVEDRFGCDLEKWGYSF